MVQAHEGRYLDVRIVRSQTAKSETKCWYVEYRMASEDSNQRAVDDMQLRRINTEIREHDELYVVPASEWGQGRPGLYRVVNFSHGWQDSANHVYEVDLIHGECTCEDWVIRGRLAGFACKHVLRCHRYGGENGTITEGLFEREEKSA